MTVQDIINLISSVGFPIVMCSALFYYMVKQQQSHSEEMEKLRGTVEENTKVLTELTTLIKEISDEKKG